MENLPLQWVIYSDEHLLVINKPSGLPVLPDGYHPENEHVRAMLKPYYGRLWIVHRLDKQTSGVLLLARSAQAHRSLNMQFDRRSVEKIYHALVLGIPTWEEITINLPLRANGDRRHRTVVDFERGKEAITLCKRLETFGGCTLLSIQPKTGRIHQIRAHLSFVGFPILGDTLYGFSPSAFSMPFPIERTALHARSISIQHPQSGETLRFNADYPTDFWEWIRRLALGCRDEANGKPQTPIHRTISS